ncbi:MAG: hypothetical protein E6G97_18925 [Alphaproteobacteria bacterium]|nr:MAG: hypothetical protein E6G97_18925 [Alphaproteobacteria bacterium]
MLAIAALFAALLDAPGALAQSPGAPAPERNSNDLRRIRCAGDAALCGWKRIPGMQIWPRRGYRAQRRHRQD